MGLRCIIGHDYGEPDRTETREDRGDERVVTVREYRECRRCGHQQVISENTEVRPTVDSSPEEESGEGGDTTEAPEAPETAGTTDQEYEDVTAEEDDGVILDDGDGEADDEREEGEWPDSEDETEEPADHDEWPDDHREKTDEAVDDERGDWPETDAEDEGFDAEPSSGGPDESVDFEGGLTPESTGTPPGVGSDAVGETGGPDADPAVGSGGESTGADGMESAIRRSDPGPSPTAQQRPADPDTVFVCPNCETTTPAHESSLRPGDICPECNRGYLTEREDA
ncbi:MAG: oxidoreductase [Halobacteriales archaeon]